MSDHIPSLADLRREIDVLDDQIQDLLRRRAEAVQRVAETKRTEGGSDGVFLRPGREAQILRRLLERHRTGLPPAALLRIWREMISSLYDLQAPVKVAVHAPNKSAARWDLARDFYGSTTPMQLCTTATAVIRAVNSQPATLGVMAMPEDGEKEVWWPLLASRAEDTPRIIARLPFVPNPRGRIAELGCYVIARTPPEESGEDCTLIVVYMNEDASSVARLNSLLAQAGLESRVLAQHRGTSGVARMLVEVTGFVPDSDDRMAAFRAADPNLISDAVVIGAYPVPVAES
ncbi:MAG TPA: chorismate mutase [Ferrovibrio sp.]|jgi:chorismate mutase/prephenate dehydratase|uniref:chorismate mutase n=1 Tax=Ferrovibrio sp. TaxID=1917215 RepID=UPI002B4B7028|nr:chorismate mutase [Ferrovibrio sp.]HLT77261.1 chorismate mutase [Ferrovibrio sp.]